jgi:hypothetical protein
MGRIEIEPVEIRCPRCKLTKVSLFLKQDFPYCPHWNVAMIIKELLDEGKP